jgi:hypothetical protein
MSECQVDNFYGKSMSMCQEFCFVLGDEPIREVYYQKKIKCQGYAPKLISVINNQN